MIFATVGTQLPFPRMMWALDRLAERHQLEIVAQTAGGDDFPHLRCLPQCAPAAFEELVRSADRIVAHAGIGSIITARKFGKPLIVFPRRASLGEHRNEHQLATVTELSQALNLHIARDEDELESLVLQVGLDPMVSLDGGSGEKNKLLSFIHEAIGC